MDSLGVGVIGYGFIGKVHCHAHLSIPLFYSPPPARARLVGVASATEATGKAAMEQAGFRFATTDYRQIIDSEEVQIVHICTPNDLHTEQALAAIHAGKHVYCDKPLAAGLGDAQRSYQASLGAAGVCQMTFNYRFVPALLRARELAQQGFLGDLYAFRVAYLHAGYVDPSRPYSWRVDRARSGGGAVADLGSHAIDLLRFLVGPGTAVGRAGEVASITGRLQTVIP
ncbi:MAG TPA: Gfo/Idh/MocA family oxidoreductase, partial [Chthonomonadales bacterium]|nr:Gfo/Idh/MocA family oxidoreductase [Chthonomonadales bacterium]